MTLVEVEKMVNGFPLTFQEEAETAKRLGLKIVDRSALEPQEPATADESEQGEEDTTEVEETESSEEALEPQEPKKKRKK